MIAGKILIVDDEESVRVTLSSFLDDEGYVSFMAGTFEHALELVQQVRFDLIFIDIILEGGKSGIELLGEVKKMAPDTEAVIITGAPNFESASEALRLGAFDYIVKPIRQDKLLKTTEVALKHKVLSETRENYRLNLEAIFRSVRDAIVTVDEHMVMVEANEAARTLCGFGEGEIRGVPMRDLAGDCDGKCVEALRRTVASGEPIEIPCIDCESGEHPNQVVSVITTPLIRADGSASGGVLVVRSLSQLAADLEQSLAACQELRNGKTADRQSQ